MIEETEHHLLMRDEAYQNRNSNHEHERARAEWKIQARSGPFETDPAYCDIWSGNTRDVEALSAGSVSELMRSLSAIGQQVPAIARISPADPTRLEIIAGACRLTAIKQINEERPLEEQMRITVDLRQLDDEAAYRIVDAENRGRSDFSPIERARFFEKAIAAIYSTEPGLAEAYGLNKSTVNRLMAIVKLPSPVMSLIANHHEISARQASEFMSDWTSPLQEKLEDTIADMQGRRPASAATVFKALKLAVAPPDEVGEAPVLHEEVSYGSIRRGKQGGVRINLLPSRGEISLKALVTAVGHALKKLDAED